MIEVERVEEDLGRRLTLALDQNDIDAAEGLITSACQSLRSESVPDEPSLASLLSSLLNVFRATHPSLEELFERCGLDLCAPVLLSGVLGTSCRQHAEGILGVLAEVGPGRDVFTGNSSTQPGVSKNQWQFAYPEIQLFPVDLWINRAVPFSLASFLKSCMLAIKQARLWKAGIVEGVSLIPSESWNDVAARHLGCAILRELPTVLSRIKRRKQAYLGHSLTFTLQLAQKLTSSDDDSEIIEQLKSMFLFARACPKACGYDDPLDTLPKEISLALRAFLVLLTKLYLSKLVVRMAVGDIKDQTKFSDDMLVMIAQFLYGAGFEWADFDRVDELIAAWVRMADDTNDADIKREIRASVGFLLWGCFCSERLSKALHHTINPGHVLETATEMCKVVSDDPTVFAGLALVSAMFKTPEFKREVLGRGHMDTVAHLFGDLIEHMDGNLNMQLRMVCLTTAKAILEAANESMQWHLFRKAFACPYPDVAAVLFQDFKSSVVKARQSGGKSRFNSPDVVDVIKDIITVDHGGWEGVMHSSDILTAALNLYRYLVANLKQTRYAKDDLGVVGRDVVDVVSGRCKFFRECVQQGVKDSTNSEGKDHIGDVLGLERLDEVVSRVEELIE